MTESPPKLQTANRKTRKVPIQERSVRVGSFIVVNGSRVNRGLLKARFAQGSYQAHETSHFLLFLRPEAPSTILVHWFRPQEIDTDVSHYLVQELKPFGIITCGQHLSELLTGIVGGTLYPDDVRRAWNYFGVNTLQRLLTFLCTAGTPSLKDYGTLSASATLYQRVCELCVGESFLDAACNGGFLSLLLAERLPFVTKAVGVDIDPHVFVVAQRLAEERHLKQVQYVQADLLADDFDRIGRFDTVTALHVIEHFSEEELYRVLTNLLRVTSRRLLLAVPYEHEHAQPEKPEVAYGHLQFYSRPKLEAVGAWCLQQMRGAGRVWYEDFIGGLLLIERC